MNGVMRVLEPVAPRLNAPRQTRLALDGVRGKMFGFIDNGKPNFNYLVDDLADILMSKYGVASVVKRRKRGAGIPASDEVMQELFEQCHAVIAGSGD